MSLLNQLFNRGLQGSKCKTCLTLAISRIKLLQNKRDVQLKLMRKEIAQFLTAGQESIAQIRVEHVIREENIWAAYEILEMFCEFVLARVPILESQRECPSELQEAVASIIFAAPRCSDLPDLLHVRTLFTAKYGKDFVSAASELRPDTSVNRTIIEKLSVCAPSANVKMKVLTEIAHEYNVDWDSSKTLAEFSKKPEDLLNGPKQIDFCRLTSEFDPHESQSVMKHSLTSLNCKEGKQSDKSSSTVSRMSLAVTTTKPSNLGEHTGPTGNIKEDTNVQPSDALQRARAAIAAAKRATAAAHAVSQLVNHTDSSVELAEGNREGVD